MIGKSLPSGQNPKGGHRFSPVENAKRGASITFEQEDGAGWQFHPAQRL